MIIVIGVAFAIGIIGWIYKAFIKPLPPKICGSSNGPPLTSPRIKLNDGRHLAYRELGVPKEEARHKIIICHGLDSCKDMDIPISTEVMDELKVYFLIYDRAGYCESDPYSSRSVKTEAFDIQELADKMELGTKFYVIGFSMGGYPIWSCLKYIPHRLLGASLVVPLVNYWWHSFPSSLIQHSFWKKLPKSYTRTCWIAYYTPWLIHLWMTQKWFPKWGAEDLFPDSDLVVLKYLLNRPEQKKVLQQGAGESLHRDLRCGFGKWEFDPMDLTNPFPDNNGSVHMWLGTEDRIFPYEFNRFIAQKLPWIKCHEMPKYGHLLVHEDQNFEAIVRALLVG